MLCVPVTIMSTVIRIVMQLRREPKNESPGGGMVRSHTEAALVPVFPQLINYMGASKGSSRLNTKNSQLVYITGRPSASIRQL